MSEQTNPDPVRFVPVEPRYPRTRLLADVPEGHMVENLDPDRSVPCVVIQRLDAISRVLTVYAETKEYDTSKGEPATQMVMDHGPVEGMFPRAEGGWRFPLVKQPALATVRLANLNPLDVFSYNNGKKIAVVFTPLGNGRTIVGVDGMADTLSDNLVVTLLGSLKFGGGT